jgi:hypothetical protein
VPGNLRFHPHPRILSPPSLAFLCVLCVFAVDFAFRPESRPASPFQSPVFRPFFLKNRPKTEKNPQKPVETGVLPLTKPSASRKVNGGRFSQAA